MLKKINQWKQYYTDDPWTRPLWTMQIYLYENFFNNTVVHDIRLVQSTKNYRHGQSTTNYAQIFYCTDG